MKRLRKISGRRWMFFRILILGITATCCVAARGDSPQQPQRLLLVGQSPDDHRPSTHEYMAGIRQIRSLLQDTQRLDMQLVKADDPWNEGPDLLARADGAVLMVSEGARWIQSDAARHEAFSRLAARGGGLVALHWSMGTRDAQYVDGFVRLFGACHGGPDRRHRVVQTSLRPAGNDHPIARAVTPLDVREEFYYRLKFGDPLWPAQPVLTATIEDQAHTVAWGWERPDGGRSFGFSGLHFHDNWRHEPYRRVVAQGILWTLNRPIPAGGIPVADYRSSDP